MSQRAEPALPVTTPAPASGPTSRLRPPLARRLGKAVRAPRLATAHLGARLRQTRPGIRAIDRSNALRFGADAPRVAQRIWVDPRACSLVLREHALGPAPHSYSGVVLRGDWDRRTKSVHGLEKLGFAVAHWSEGVPWKETGAYEYMLRLIAERGRAVDGCVTIDDVVARYRRLDDIFEQVRREGRLRPRTEVVTAAFRERKGVLVHVGRDVEPIFGGGSHNRLAMALVLDLEIMPAQIGAVHRDALRHWKGALCDPRA